MTPSEAEIILQLNSFDNLEDAVENQLFEIRQQLISKVVLPQLLKARKQKLIQLKTAAEVSGFEFKNSSNSLVLKSLKELTLIDTFNIFQENKTKILQQLSTELSFENIENCIDLFSENLRNWCHLWPIIEVGNANEILLSRELESMRFYEILKSLQQKNIDNFDALVGEEIPLELQLEIARLNEINKLFQ
jgi:hypothetical protein